MCEPVKFLSGIAQQVTTGTTNLKLRTTSLTVGLRLLCVVVLGYLVLSSIAIGNSQDDKSKRGSFVHIEPNHYSPNLYSESLDSKFTLINLPGASQPGSFWELEYEIYFVSEAAFRETMRRLVGVSGSANPQASDFQEKILLRRGKFKVTRLSSLDDRTRLIGLCSFLPTDRVRMKKRSKHWQKYSVALVTNLRPRCSCSWERWKTPLIPSYSRTRRSTVPSLVVVS